MKASLQAFGIVNSKTPHQVQKPMKMLSILLTAMGLVQLSTAGTLHVDPGDDVQTAIAAASSGDIVVLNPGTHSITGEISITKGITLTGTGSYTNTVIDANRTTRCLVVDHPVAVVDGLTVSRGWTVDASGAGVFCDAGAVINCLIVSNTVVHAGDNYQGGGVYCGADGFVSNCVFTGNSAPYGGGIYCAEGGVVQDCVMSNNAASYYGGGVYCRGLVQRSVIIENTAPGGAGAECSSGGLLDRCMILGNQAVDSGGGAFVVYASIQNCLIAENRADNGAGLCLGSDAVVKHCTVCRNTASGNGGGIKGYSTSATFNTIVWSNEAPVSPNVGPAGLYSNCCSSGLAIDAHNVPLSPDFIDIVSGDYRLTFRSPCIDAGCPNAGASVDYQGLARPVDGDGNGMPAFDIGAYEYVLDPQHLKVPVLISGGPQAMSSAWALDYGLHQIATGKVILVAVPEEEESNGTRHISTGWAGKGSIPRSGTGNFVVAAVSNSSALTWLWQTQHQLTLESPKGTITGAASGYWDEGTPFALQFEATNGYALHHWTVDEQYAGRGEPLLLVADGPHHVQAFAEPFLSITNIVAFDPTPWPGINRSITEWTENELVFTSGGMGLHGKDRSIQPSNGTAYLTPGNKSHPLTWIRATCEGAIRLLSADIAEYSTVYWEPMVVFIGHKSAGGTITNTFALDGLLDGPGGIVDFQSVTFSEAFRDLAAVEIPHPGLSLDNVRYVLTPPDADRDGMDDAWEKMHFGNTSRNGTNNADGDALTDRQEWVAGSDPTNANSAFAIADCQAISGPPRIVVRWDSTPNRLYSVRSSGALTGTWTDVFTAPGADGSMSFTQEYSTNGPIYFRVHVRE